MNAERLTRRALILSALPTLALAQTIRPADDGFARPSRDVSLSFPRDHGSHPDFRIEWWYVTANLTGADGTRMGVQWTLFRSTLSTGDGVPQAWLGHAALTTAEEHFAAERMGRGGTGQAGVRAAPFEARIDDWVLEGPDLNDLRVRAAGETFAYDLSLTADTPVIPQGEAGYSVKSDSGIASIYYSQPFYRVRGRVTLPSGEVEVTGEAWLDREWSSDPLEPGQLGWDWISMHLDSGQKVTAAQVRQDGAAPFTFGTWIEADGRADPVPDGGLILTPLETATVAGRALPVRWRVELPAQGLDVEIAALNREAWMDLLYQYWEGPVAITGSHPGRGYLEMTGYE